MIEGQSEFIQPNVPTAGVETVLYGNLEQALHTDQYEVALQASEDVQSLRSWRAAERNSPSPHFYRLFEASTRLNATFLPQEEKERLRLELADQLLPAVTTMTPRIRDLYMGLVSELDGSDYAPQFPMTEHQLQTLKESGDLQVLQDPSIPWNIKLNRMQTRVESELMGRKALDRRDKILQEEEKRQIPQLNLPPPISDESKPSMDEMERLKEGEVAPAIWTISPAFGGYYKKQSYDTWDAQRNTWRQSHYNYTSDFVVHPEALQSPVNPVVLSVYLTPGQTVRIPKSYTYEFSKVLQGHASALMDQNDDFILRSNALAGERQVKVQFSFLGQDGHTLTSREDPAVLSMPAMLSKDTEQKIAEIAKSRIGNVVRARALSAYTMRHLQYSNDSSFNATYENDPNGYVGAIDRYKQADCDVANTYFAALCSRLNIPVRHVTGHMVKGKDNEGNARITSGTGHAWTEVWDEKAQLWVRIDATPPGDPQMEKRELQGEKGMEGDYGGEEIFGPNDKQLEELEEKLKVVAERLSYTQEEQELAKENSIEPRDARRILREIKQTEEETRLPNGERVMDVLSQFWSLIAQSRMVTQPSYDGPLRRREGGEEIENIVAHRLGVLAGDFDPPSRRHEVEEVKVEPIPHKQVLFMILDKSGSTGSLVEGLPIWKFQQTAAYLIESSFEQARRNLRKMAPRLKDPLDLYSEIVSFRGETEMDIDKPLSNALTGKDKVRIWASLAKRGFGNGDVATWSYVKNRINELREEEKSAGKTDETIYSVIGCSDGEPDNPNAVRHIASSLGQEGTVVTGVGLTQTAKKVPIIFNTPYTSGDLAEDLTMLIPIIAKHYISGTMTKLIPPSALSTYQRSVDAILAKFDRVGAK